MRRSTGINLRPAIAAIRGGLIWSYKKVFAGDAREMMPNGQLMKRVNKS
jgi:hypothetical protein